MYLIKIVAFRCETSSGRVIELTRPAAPLPDSTAATFTPPCPSHPERPTGEPETPPGRADGTAGGCPEPALRGFVLLGKARCRLRHARGLAVPRRMSNPQRGRAMNYREFMAIFIDEPDVSGSGAPAADRAAVHVHEVRSRIAPDTPCMAGRSRLGHLVDRARRKPKIGRLACHVQRILRHAA